MIIIESANLGEAMELCDTIFDKSQGTLVLTSGHRSKGFEWEEVWHLDSHRLPSKYALKQAKQGYPGALHQEENLLYVIETRTKDKLYMIQLDQCADQLPEIEDEEG
jgi:superfamily I DNA/RNA helicase